MLTKPSLAAAALALFAWASCSHAVTPVKAFDKFVAQYRNEQRIQSLSVAVARGDDIIFAKGYGFQDHDAEEPTTADTTYLVASITKTFTGATLLAMEADGHLSLQDDFTELSDWSARCDWLAGSGIIFGGGTATDGTTVEPVPCDQPLTLEQVLTHRVNGNPGEGFLYNPVVFGRLSNWVEEQTERSWRDWMRHYVIEPADLDGVAAGWRDPQASAALTRLAPPFRHTDPTVDRDGVAPSILPNPELNASSGIIASVVGLARYAMALQDGRILPPDLLQRLWRRPQLASGEPSPHALGWYVEDLDGRRVVWHGGWWPDAYAGLLLIVPAERLVLVALGNTDGLRWEKPLNSGGIEASALAARFLELFGNGGG